MKIQISGTKSVLNPLKLNDPYRGRTAQLTSKRCILYIYSTNISTEYFKHGKHSPFFSSSKCSLFHNSNVFGSCVTHIFIQGVLKLKKNNSGARKLMSKKNLIVAPCIFVESLLLSINNCTYITFI